jgi:NTP pyrophosphatase (non-canonical NTP hydrolase)
LKDILNKIIEFRDARDWKKHDSPENLAKSIIIEAAELLENFQWNDESFDEVNVKEELADVLIYSLALVHDMGYNLEEIIEDKLKKNAIKYPIIK